MFQRSFKFDRGLFLILMLWAASTALSDVVDPPPRRVRLPGTGTANPTTYSSKSGMFTLFVDPEDSDGSTGAEYRFKENETIIWSGKRPYTLREVTITDAGIAVGMAYRETPVSKDEPGNLQSYLHMVILDRTGKELLNEIHTRGFALNFHMGPVPEIERFMVDLEQDRLVAQVDECDAESSIRQDRYCWIYRISTGEKLGHFNPRKTMADSNAAWHLFETRPLPGTPLILNHWYTRSLSSEVGDGGARFTLVDVSGKPIWTFDAVRDYVGIGFGQWVNADYFKKNPALFVDAEPKQFSIRLFAPNEKVTFTVECPSEGNWTVTERTRGTFKESSPPQKTTTPKRLETDAPQIEFSGELTYLGAIQLDGDVNADSTFPGFIDLTIDRSGRIFALARKTGGLHIFNARGEIETITAPDVGDFVGAVTKGFVVLDPSGEIYVQAKDEWSMGAPYEYIRFSSKGDRIGKVTIKVPYDSLMGPGWLFQPETGNTCGFSMFPTKLVIQNPKSETICEVKKSPDGQWLTFPFDLAVAPDGSIAVLQSVHELGDDQDRRMASRELALFGRDGDPIRSISLPVPQINPYSAVAFDGRRVVACAPREVSITDAATGEIKRWRLVEPGVINGRWKAYLVNDGTELWLNERRWISSFDDGSGGYTTIHRYRLP